MNDDPALTTVFVDRKATKRKLRKSRLVVEDGPEKGTRLDIASERMTIGRSGICDLPLTDDASKRDALRDRRQGDGLFAP